MSFYTWCPSTFTELVKHVRENEGDEKAPCGQTIKPGEKPKTYSAECRECTIWEARQTARWLIRNRRRRKRTP